MIDNSSSHDALFSQPQDTVPKFIFDDSVADVFPNMIQRSVPGYGMTISLIGVIAQRYAQPNSHCYDLGCSLGAATLSMRQNIQVAPCKIIAVDNSSAMLERCQQNISADKSDIPVETQCADIQQIPFSQASVVVLNFTLQFIPLEERLALLSKIYAGMLPGGVLLLSEKIAFPETQLQTLHTELHHDFKKLNGYSDLEVSQKRAALENVLIPETLDAHHTRLKQAGFSNSAVWLQCFNFASLIALKQE